LLVGLVRVPNLCAARTFALAASASRSRGVAVDFSEPSSCADTLAMSSTAAANAFSFAFEGRLKPLILRTNCSDASRISCSVTGGAKLNSVLMFLHTTFTSSFVHPLHRRTHIAITDGGRARRREGKRR